jgi:hypothetical protein
MLAVLQVLAETVFGWHHVLALESAASSDPGDRGEVDIMRPSEGCVASSILAGRTNHP